MEPPIAARHLLVCRGVAYDPRDEQAPYSLSGVVSHLGPADGYAYPLCVEMLWLYAEFHGAPGRYATQVVLYHLDPDGGGGRPVAVYVPKPVRVRRGAFVDGARFCLTKAVFDEPGLYEFRLFVVGFGHPVASERVYLTEV